MQKIWDGGGLILEWIEPDGFLSFGQRVRLEVGSGLTVVTGPNGAGKSNLGRCLDLARAVLGRASGDPAAGRLGVYEDAGFEGAGSFNVRLGITLDQQWEQELVRAFVRACFATLFPAQTSPDARSAEELDEVVTAWLAADSLAPLWSGSLVISYDRADSQPWFAAWEFGSLGQLWHAGLVGRAIQQLRPGPTDARSKATGSGSFTDWLMESKPQDSLSLDFRIAMQKAGRAVTFVVQPVANRGERTPESVRRLGSMLGTDYDNRTFTFDHVMSIVLRRGAVLTDNRRLPFARQFTLEELSGQLDLQDGAAVGAELYRLKNGYPDERQRFGEIQATFKALTGHDLEVRARPAPQDGSAAMIVEPTVNGRHGERLVELSGAGMQEALVLSTLLDRRSGRIAVLDEPAVNLEPTVQRRLIGRVRGPGQHLVITHSADLVPYEEPGDLSRIVRVAQGPSGSCLCRPRPQDGAGTDDLRELKLMEPADVRALLFAAGVILCEGTTETGAMPRWWRNASAHGLPDPEAANIAVITVGGEKAYGSYLRYLNGFGVPWAIIADGPALRPGSQLAKDLSAMGRWPDKPPDDGEDFAKWRDFWERAGVFSLADQFGDDGSKTGEFEAFLRRVDPDLFEEARRAGGKSKPRAGAFFALNHPEPPPDVMNLYVKIAAWLQLPDTVREPAAPDDVPEPRFPAVAAGHD